MLRVANNASKGARRQDPQYKGLPDNSTGSKNRPFYAAKDESQTPLVPKISSPGGVRGGVLRNFGYAKQILQQRKRDIEAQEAALAGLPVVLPMSPTAGLSPDEVMLYDLNERMNTLYESIDVGAISDQTLQSFRDVPKFLIQSAHLMSASDLAKLQQMTINMERVIRENELEGPEFKLAQRLLDSIQGFIGAFIPKATQDVNEKRVTARSLGMKFFNTTGDVARQAQRAADTPEVSQLRATLLDQVRAVPEDALPSLYQVFVPNGRAATAIGRKRSLEAAIRQASAERLETMRDSILGAMD